MSSYQISQLQRIEDAAAREAARRMREAALAQRELRVQESLAELQGRISQVSGFDHEIIQIGAIQVSLENSTSIDLDQLAVTLERAEATLAKVANQFETEMALRRARAAATTKTLGHARRLGRHQPVSRGRFHLRPRPADASDADRGSDSITDETPQVGLMRSERLAEILAMAPAALPTDKIAGLIEAAGKAKNAVAFESLKLQARELVSHQVELKRQQSIDALEAQSLLLRLSFMGPNDEATVALTEVLSAVLAGLRPLEEGVLQQVRRLEEDQHAKLLLEAAEAVGFQVPPRGGGSAHRFREDGSATALTIQGGTVVAHTEVPSNIAIRGEAVDGPTCSDVDLISEELSRRGFELRTVLLRPPGAVEPRSLESDGDDEEDEAAQASGEAGVA